MTKVDKNYEWFENNLTSLLRKYKNKYVIIIDQKVTDEFDTFEEAVEKAKTYKIGDFIIQKVEKPNDNNIQVFHTRAIFR